LRRKRKQVSIYYKSKCIIISIDAHDSPVKSQTSEKKQEKDKGRTLLNSKKSSRKNKQMTESVRQSTGGLPHDLNTRAGDTVTAPFGPGPQESEEDKVKRYERIIQKLKKTLEFERKNLKGSRHQYQLEMNHKTELEDMLKE
jgi:hypothetical protein